MDIFATLSAVISESQVVICPSIKPRQEFTWPVHRKLKQQVKNINEKGLK